MIIKIKGTSQAARLLGDSLRNTAIGKRYGALLIHPETLAHPKGAPGVKELLEKIIDGEQFNEDALKDEKLESYNVQTVKWKKNPTIVFVGDEAFKYLALIEKACPGFTKKFGPVSEIAVD